MTSLIDHIEKYCGTITFGIAHETTGEQLPFQVVHMDCRTIADTQVLATLGLSNYGFLHPTRDKVIRHELLLMIRKGTPPSNLLAALLDVGLEALVTGTAYLRGDVIGPRDSLVAGSQLSALYVTVPVYLPDEFHSFKREDGESVVFVWLIPISMQEALLVKSCGWNALEDEFERQDPDLLDLHRQSVVS